MEFDDVLKNTKLLCGEINEGIDRKACYERAGKFALTYYGYYNHQSFEQGMRLCARFNGIEKSRCLNGLFVFPENCKRPPYECGYLVRKERFLNWIYDLGLVI